MLMEVEYFFSETDTVESRLTEMVQGTLSVDAVNCKGEHFALVLIRLYPPSMATKLFVLKPRLDLMWDCFVRASHHYTWWIPIVCSSKFMGHMWSDLGIVEQCIQGMHDNRNFKPVFEELTKRRWLASARRAWLVAIVQEID